MEGDEGGDVRAQTLLRSSSDSTAEPEEIIKPGALTPTVQGLAAILFFFFFFIPYQHQIFLVYISNETLVNIIDNTTVVRHIFDTDQSELLLQLLRQPSSWIERVLDHSKPNCLSYDSLISCTSC